jgi:hypothetical protein
VFKEAGLVLEGVFKRIGDDWEGFAVFPETPDTVSDGY